MADTYFFTGFPGFIATRLIQQLMRDYDYEHIYLLVLPAMLEKARQVLQEMGANENRVSLLMGDITQAQLGLDADNLERLKDSVTHVFHLAAVYDLAVPFSLAYDVNVNGTCMVNEWVRSLTKLKRYVYFSTAYVSGDREGRIMESELEMGQGFKNHYERTKYEAEVLVKRMMDEVPVMIIRPGIVKGDSRTGETVKFDGPYFMLNFFDHLRFLPYIPYLGRGEAEGNFVPVDYVLRATLYLAHTDAGIGKTYHLTDPKPYRMRDVYRMVMNEYLGRNPRGTIPLSLANLALSFSAVRKWLRVEKEALEYFTVKAEYDCSQAQRDLHGSGITCPDFRETLPAMIQFYEQHKHEEEKHITIR